VTLIPEPLAGHGYQQPLTLALSNIPTQNPRYVDTNWYLTHKTEVVVRRPIHAVIDVGGIGEVMARIVLLLAIDHH
jgi:hypothetical protein